MLPVECHAQRVIRDRKIRIAVATIGKHERLLILVVDATGMKLVGDHQLGLRAYKVTTLGSVNQAFLKEPLLGIDWYFARERIHKEIRHAPSYLRVLVACIAAILDKRPLVEDYELVLVTGERRVQQLAGEQPTRVGEHDEGFVELAALGLVYRQAVGQLERVAGFFPELSTAELVLGARLPRELDLELPRQASELALPVLVLSDYDSDVAVGEIGLGITYKRNNA